ncbi:hypothetical protein F2P56_022973 [Juglans regia]|uniref:Protein unc-13 homolog n=2 Tax=Juglans regia TaxID=51240 RepID=A0A2I4HSL2_JUGRE|nr:protein unc-13 homolog [Juglans regia]KAF5458981.1 hypothetical protein F2P56_022973 [Juglans regia]
MQQQPATSRLFCDRILGSCKRHNLSQSPMQQQQTTSRIFRDRILGSSKRHSQLQSPIDQHQQPTMSNISRDGELGYSKRHNQFQNPMQQHPVYSIEDLPYPFGDLTPNLSVSELRETAYEILVAACRSTVTLPLTCIPQPEKADRAPTIPAWASLQRSLKSFVASRVKKALGPKTSLTSKGWGGDGDSVSQGRGKKQVTVGEFTRVQMRVSEQTDSRIRIAILKIVAGQVGRRIESVVLPLELLQQFKSSDFPSQQEYEAWQRRNLKVLEAGLLLHPRLPLEKTNSAAQRLQQIIRGALDYSWWGSQSVQVLQSVVMTLACRSYDGSASEICHWADGFPLNLRLYQMLLEACFDLNEGTSVIEEVDEVLDLIKKTWVILGLNQMLHNLCFSWVLFHRYVATGQVKNELLFASNNLLMEVEKDAKEIRDPVSSKVLSSTLSVILGWAEKRLLAYHDTFHSGNIESLQSIVSIGLLSSKILVEDISHEYRWKSKEVNVTCGRVETYIRSSLRAAFAQAVNSSYHVSNNQNSSLHALCILAQDTSKLALNEKEIFSPILKKWHPLAAGVAIATLHSCYGNELMQFIMGISELTPDAIQVLKAADKLEKDLVQIVIEDAVDSEDGGKSIIREMLPYEAEAVIANMVKSWIKTRVDRLEEWTNRNLQLEVWNPRANKERIAPSAIEVLRTIDATLEVFFLLPIPMHPIFLPELMNGFDRGLQHYILKAKSGCGMRNTYVPIMPALTRCSTRSKFHGVSKKKEKTQITKKRKSHVATSNRDNSLGIPQLCVRLNTLQHIQTELGVLEKRILVDIENAERTHGDIITDGTMERFELSAIACAEGMQQLCEAMAYKIIFHDLSHVLWDSLYVGEVSSSRIEPFLQELEQFLEIISLTVHDRIRTRVITDIMKASFDGFLLVLLAGGPSRAFCQQDSAIIEEDFNFLIDLFWSNGDGLPGDLIDNYSTTVKAILSLLGTDTESLIEQFRRLNLETFGSAKSKLPLPPCSGEWDPTEPNTILRVLCNRKDETAAKFLKKTYNLPKKL